nr:UDP-glucose/GDP-mannose dehydrogenase family protein [Streptomyces sp. SUK 48]
MATGLLAAGVEVSYHDPYVPEFTVGGTPLPRAENLRDALDRVDVAILLQDHACYARETLGQARCALLDTRGKAVGRRVTLL